ncbi:hypothetical protein LJC59_08515, partial [Desulfovibrio sp. OttesenSCG-928-A18]|nr:hypothetical protein [Desulfovibrio sp. OttesenSCG-928-A18]
RDYLARYPNDWQGRFSLAGRLCMLASLSAEPKDVAPLLRESAALGLPLLAKLKQQPLLLGAGKAGNLVFLLTRSALGLLPLRQGAGDRLLALRILAALEGARELFPDRELTRSKGMIARALGMSEDRALTRRILLAHALRLADEAGDIPLMASSLSLRAVFSQDEAVKRPLYARSEAMLLPFFLLARQRGLSIGYDDEDGFFGADAFIRLYLFQALDSTEPAVKNALAAKALGYSEQLLPARALYYRAEAEAVRGDAPACAAVARGLCHEDAHFAGLLPVMVSSWPTYKAVRNSPEIIELLRECRP